MIARITAGVAFFALATMSVSDFAQAKTDCAKLCEARCKTSSSKGGCTANCLPACERNHNQK
jgi:hypothetical protein